MRIMTSYFRKCDMVDSDVNGLEGQTGERGKMSARSCLYLLTGCLDLARNAGQKQHKLSHTGNTVLATAPIVLPPQ